MIVILHSQHDAHSRSFVQTYGEGKQIITWENESSPSKQEYLDGNNPHPSAFPSVVDTETKHIIRRPLDWKEVELQFEAKSKNQAELVFDAAIASGYPIPGKDFSLGLHKEDREAFAQMLTLVQEGQHQGHIADEDLVNVSDKEGTIKQVSAQEFRQIMFGYGLYYKGLWDTLKQGVG